MTMTDWECLAEAVDDVVRVPGAVRLGNAEIKALILTVDL